MDDVQTDDPLFILRRAVAYRSSASSRHRLSAPLDEIALSHLHRDSSASASSSATSDTSTMAPPVVDELKSRQPSRAEVIAAQRAATRANQEAILSKQVNAQRGVDVMLPDRGMLRSQRYDADDRVRYSYVQPDGETYDVSDIVEEELKGTSEHDRPSSPSSTASNDLLSGILSGSQSNDLISRVLSKINGKNGTALQSSTLPTARSTSPSLYSDDGKDNKSEQVSPSASRSVTPTANTVGVQRSMTPESRSRSVTPTAALAQSTAHRQFQPSIESVLSDVSDYRTAASGTPTGRPGSSVAVQSPSPSQSLSQSLPKRLRIPKDEFGLTEMLAIIDSKAVLTKPNLLPPIDDTDKLYFGQKVDLESVHPLVREVYAGTFKKMNDLDAVRLFLQYIYADDRF